MPGENDYSNAHLILPIVHPNGEVHDVAVHEDTPIAELHRGLLDSGYGAPDVETEEQKLNFRVQGAPRSQPVDGVPTREGTVEYDPKFKEAAAQVWRTSNRGKDDDEVTLDLNKDLDRGTLGISKGKGRAKVNAPADSPYFLHTHDNTAGGQPSPQDIATAKRLKKYIYVVSKSGLQYVGPHGEVGTVYRSPAEFGGDK